MPYGIIKVDTVTFTDNGIDKNISLSGLVQNPTFTGNVTATGTISGDVIRGGTTISGVTVTGTTANFVSGVFTTQVSGVTVIATTGTFTSLTGTTTTGTTANFASGIFTTQVSGTTVIATTGTFTSLTGTTTTGTTANFASGIFTTQVSGTTVIAPTGTFTSLTGTTTTGTTANFASGVFTTQVSGTTVIAPTGTFTSLTGTTATFTSGIIASGTAALPSLAILSDPNTGIFSPGADQLAISTNGTGALFVDGLGRVGIGAASSGARLDIRGGSGPYMYIVDSGANGGAFVAEATNSIVNVGSTYLGTSAVPLALVAGATERARIRADGLFEIKGAGTAGSSPAFSVNQSAPANSFFIDSGGKLGLGNSSPSTTLDVTGAISLGAVAIPSAGTARIFSRNTDNNLYIQTGSGSTLNLLDGSQNTMASFGSSTVTLQTANSPRLTITSTGLVGIGTTSPTVTLHVNGQQIFNGPATLQSSGVVRGYFGDVDNDTNIQLRSEAQTIFKIGNNEAVRIDASRRLLVGTATARSNFFRQGTTGITPFTQIESAINSYNNGLSVINNSASGFAAMLNLATSYSTSLNSNVIGSANQQVGTINFLSNDGTNFVDCAQIRADVDGDPAANDMPGRLVFSTTADGASSPTERMRIKSDGVTSFGQGSTGPGSGVAGTLINAGDGGILITNNTAPFLRCYTLSGGFPDALQIANNGNVTNANNSYGGISDIRLKENIVDATSQWDDLKAIQVRKYNFKEGQTHTQIGLIAQEVELVSPGLVSESPDRDAEGNDLGTVTKSVNYSVLYMKAVKALQEAMERIESLEASNADILTRLSALEAA